MITRRVKIQLAVFSALTAVALALIVFHYVKVPTLMGAGQVQASAIFSEGAGIYPHANVTYRGVTVGKVTDVTLDPQGVKVSFRVSSSAHVPSDVTASIKSVSAIGEQYVDLIPRGTGDAMLADGAVIPRAYTSTPVQIADVLDDTSSLLESVPLKDLDTVLREADLAFKNLGPKLDSLTTNAMDLVNDANANYEPTHQLLADGNHFLDGQLQSRSAMTAWSRDLASFTTELDHGDAKLRAMLESIPGAAKQGKATIDMLNAELPPLLTSGQVLADLAADYNAPIEQVLNVFPVVAMKAIAYMTADPTGARLGFKSVVNYPGSCSVGWPKPGEPLGPRDPWELKDEPLPDTYCHIPQSDNRFVRGARNLQCFEPGSPPGRRAATIYQCRGDGYGDSGGDVPQTNYVEAPGADLINGLLSGLDDANSLTTATGGDGSTTTRKERSWQALVLEPLTS